jgi:hypothetical protein
MSRVQYAREVTGSKEGSLRHLYRCTQHENIKQLGGKWIESETDLRKAAQTVVIDDRDS